MEFVSKGVAQHEFIGQYLCGCCGHEETGSYCEMSFSSGGGARTWNTRGRQESSPEAARSPDNDVGRQEGEIRWGNRGMPLPE